MAPDIRVSREQFFELVAPLYRQLQSWAMSPEEKAAHVEDYYRVLSGFKPKVIETAVEDLLRGSTRLPPPSVFSQACGEARRRLNREYLQKHPEKVPDALHCQCGCGGKRWAQWLPPDPAHPHVPRSRDYVTCLFKKTNLPPTGRNYLDERGVPVFGDPHHGTKEQ